MTTSIPQAVIQDLLPLYWADETSSETTAIISAYLEANPDFAASQSDSAELALLDLTDIPKFKELEMETFEKTKQLIGQRSTFIALSLFFLGMASAFRFDSNGFYWFWNETPQIAAVLFIIAAVMLIRLATVLWKLRTIDM